jgi:Zn-dependent protease
MLLAEPQRTPYDLHFRLLGIPVRISPFFWVASFLLGWGLVQSFAGPGKDLSMGAGLCIWTVAVLISILVHEFGHALAFRRYGVDADVILYHFGGLAVPRRSYTGRLPWQDPKKQLVISAAGPVVQLMLGIGVAAIFYFDGYHVPNPVPYKFVPWFPERYHMVGLFEFQYTYPPPAIKALEISLIFSSVFWSLLNLLPIYPLDGGQISRELFTLANPREGIRFSLMLSVAAGAAVAAWGFMHQDMFMGLMFGMLAYSSFAALQAYFGRGGGFGGGRF